MGLVQSDSFEAVCIWSHWFLVRGDSALVGVGYNVDTTDPEIPSASLFVSQYQFYFCILADSYLGVPLHSQVFSRMLDWEYGPGSDELWASLIPNSGLVMIKYPEQYNLEPGIETMEPDASVYGVAVTHQYHCLVGVLWCHQV